MDPTIYLYYRLYTAHAPVPSQFALEANDSNLSGIDVDLLAPPYTVENIAQFIVERERVPDKSARAMVYIDRKDAEPAPDGTIIDITEGQSTKPSMAIRIVLPADSLLWTLTARYSVTEDKVNGWLQSGKYLHEHTKEPVLYLPFAPGDKFTTDGVAHRLDTPGWKDVWKVTNIANGEVGYVEAYEYDSRFTRTKSVGGVQKDMPCQPTAPSGITKGEIPCPVYKGTRFDWLDASTYRLPFDAATEGPIDRVYLIAPAGVTDPGAMKPFIDFALAKGVKRFVLMSAALLEKGGPALGQIHEYLSTLNVEFCVLRPSWFFDNFAHQFAPRIKSHNDFVSSAKNGRIPYVSTEDIADVAFKALVDPKIAHDNPIIVGPELFSYDQIAALLSAVLGRTITYTRLEPEAYKNALVARGLPEGYAQFMMTAESLVAQGAEEQAFHKADVVGTRTLKSFFEENKDVWQAD
ncbi:hypothetical protein B0H11DRAFT_2277707 [Mycena galericulata]|nr:hypothetical protein B0H11DRAFT_2277707 [Mycena galericulata]